MCQSIASCLPKKKRKNIGKIHKRHENHLPPTKRMKTGGCCTIKREKMHLKISQMPLEKQLPSSLIFLNRYKNRRENSGSQLCLSWAPRPKDWKQRHAKFLHLKMVVSVGWFQTFTLQNDWKLTKHSMKKWWKLVVEPIRWKNMLVNLDHLTR